MQNALKMPCYINIQHVYTHTHIYIYIYIYHAEITFSTFVYR